MLDSGPENQDLLHPAHSPDWDTIAFDVHCSRCGYNLRTLTRPKCPECGLEFHWHDVLDRAAHRSDFLFEHNWRSRPVRSFLATLTRSFRPRKFWAGVSIHNRVNRAVLWAYIPLVIAGFSIVLHGTAWCVAMAVSPFASPPAPRAFSNPPTKPKFTEVLWHYEDACRQMARVPLELPEEHVWTHVSIAIVILSAFLVLRLMWQTLAKYNILGAHVLRVVVYAALPATIWSAFLLFAQFSIMISLFLFVFADDKAGAYVLIPFYLTSILAVALPLAIYLSAGLKLYLHLPRPRVIAAMATFVAALALFTFLTTLVATGIIH